MSILQNLTLKTNLHEEEVAPSIIASFTFPGHDIVFLVEKLPLMMSKPRPATLDQAGNDYALLNF